MKLNVAAKNIKFGTNVLDIEVPAVLNEKFATGLEYIDLALGGLGFTPSTVTLFTGTPGAGKTTMMLTLADRITKEGGIALFNTAEESLFQTSMTAKRLRLKHGFHTGNTASVQELLDGCREIMNAQPDKRFFLILDSLQCMFDPKYGDGHVTGKGSERVLAMITEFCKETNAIAVCISQVTKSGQMAGSNKLKHMVDAYMHLSVEQKEQDLLGCRVLETQKNRFGGCGYVFYLQLGRSGFKQLAKVETQ